MENRENTATAGIMAIYWERFKLEVYIAFLGVMK